MTPLLSTNNLSCERGGILLFENLQFSLSGGQLVQVTGPNGSGKSTLLRILAGLSSIYSGSMERQQGCDILYLGHKPGIKAMLTPVENLRWYVDSLLRVKKTDADILQALANWQLVGYEHQLCYQLSAGQQQRVALARLNLSGAKVWLLDEPFTAIDQAGVAQLESVILAHAQSGGAVILTTHHVFRDNSLLRRVALRGNG